MIFGVGKKDVVVGLDKMGLCTSLGTEPVGRGYFGRHWRVCAWQSRHFVWCMALLAREQCYWNFPPLSRGCANIWHFLHALDWKLGDLPFGLFRPPEVLRSCRVRRSGELSLCKILELVLTIHDEMKGRITFVPLRL